VIKSVQINNFGGIENLKIDCGKFNIFQGDSDQGKTTVLLAIDWCINGGNDETVVRNGTNTCEVILHSDNGSRIERRLTRGGTNKLFVYKNEEPLPRPQELLSKIYNPIIFSPTAMVSMKPKDLNEFIQTALSTRLKLTPEQISEFELAEIDLSINPIQAIQNLYDKSYASRTEINRNVKTLSGAKPVELVEVKLEDIPNLEKEIEQLKQSINSSKQNNMKIEISKQHQIARESTVKTIADLKREISGLDFTPEQIKEFEKEYAVKTTAFKTMQSELEKERVQATILKDTLEKLEGGQIKCPINNIIVCTTDMTSYKQDLTEERNKLVTEGKKKFAESQKLEKEVASLLEKISIGKDVEKKKLELSRAEGLLTSLDVYDGTVIDYSDLEKQLTEKSELLMKCKISSEVGKNTGLEDLQKRQRALDDKIKKLDNLIKNVIPGLLTLKVKDVTIGKDGLFFRGLPLYRLGDSVKLRLCTAILKDIFPNANLFNLDGMECIDKKAIVKYVDYLSNDTTKIQYFGTYVGDLDGVVNNKVKLFTLKGFKVT